MNAETFDFNIKNYSINDLEKFLGLDKEYNPEDVNQKTNEFLNKIKKINDEKFKKNLDQFIQKVKESLTSQHKKNQIIAAGSTFIIKDPKEPVTNYVQQVYTTDIAKGDITILKKKTTTTSFCINTMFRDSSSTSATDCVMELPYQLKNVLSMEVTSVEIPQGIYLFSDYLLSNTIYFKVYSGSTTTEKLIHFPQGNYPTLTNSLSSNNYNLDVMMTTTLNSELSTNTFNVSVNKATNQVTISNSTYIFEMYIIYQGTNKDIKKTMGWILGFRNPFYVNEKSYTSESLYNTTPAEYLYLEINDYNIPSISSKVFGLFSESFLDKNIIAKIDYCYKTNYPLFETICFNKSRVLSSLREYFGPVYLGKFSIRLLDKFGQVVDLNGLDYSFTLELKILYDL